MDAWFAQAESFGNSQKWTCHDRTGCRESERVENGAHSLGQCPYEGNVFI